MAPWARQTWPINAKTSLLVTFPPEKLKPKAKNVFFFDFDYKTCCIRRGFEQLSSSSGWRVMAKRVPAPILAISGRKGLKWSQAGRYFTSLPLLQSESLSGICAKLHTMAASNDRDHASQSLLLLLAPRICIVVLCAHSVHGESHNQTQWHRRSYNTTKLELDLLLLLELGIPCL